MLLRVCDRRFPFRLINPSAKLVGLSILFEDAELLLEFPLLAEHWEDCTIIPERDDHLHNQHDGHKDRQQEQKPL